MSRTSLGCTKRFSSGLPISSFHKNQWFLISFSFMFCFIWYIVCLLVFSSIVPFKPLHVFRFVSLYGPQHELKMSYSNYSGSDNPLGFKYLSRYLHDRFKFTDQSAYLVNVQCMNMLDCFVEQNNCNPIWMDPHNLPSPAPFSFGAMGHYSLTESLSGSLSAPPRRWTHGKVRKRSRKRTFPH